MWRGLLDIKKFFNIFLLANLFLVPHFSQAQFQNATFWKKRSWSLRYSTTSQTLLAGNCSGITTIRSYNPSGAIANVTSNLTISLSGPGSITFFSDNNCTSPITQLTMTSGTSTSSFYFIDTSTSTITVTASATDFISAAQNETINSNPYVWTGGGANPNWSTGANWSGGAAPGSTHKAILNSTCVTNCDPLINSNISIGGLRMEAGYNGTVTQDTGFTITVSNSPWIVRSGTFLGGNSTISFSQTHLQLAGGSFRSTSGTLSIYRSSGGNADYFINPVPAQFLHNSGVINITGFSITPVIDADQTVFYSLSLTTAGIGLSLSSKTINLVGTLSLSDTNASVASISSGTINLTGNLTITNKGKGGTSGLIRIAGNSNQTIDSSTATEPNIPSLQYISTGGTVTVNGNLRARGNLTYTSGTISDASTTYTLVDSKTIIGGGKTWGSVYVTTGTFDFNAGTMIVGGTLTLATSDLYTYISNGTLEARGNVVFLSNGKRTTTTGFVKIAGSSNQTITSTAATNPWTGNFEIASTGGTVTIDGDITYAGLAGNTHAFRHTSGTVSWPTGAFRVSSDGATLNFYAGTIDYPNLIIQTSTGSSMNLQGSTVKVKGDFLAGDGAGFPGSITNGILQVEGNVTFNQNGKYGSAQMQLVGTNSSTISAATAGRVEGTWTINRGAGVVTLGANLGLSASSQDITIVSGTLDMNARNLSVNGTVTINSGATLTCNGGVLSYGSIVNNGTLNCP